MHKLNIVGSEVNFISMLHFIDNTESKIILKKIIYSFTSLSTKIPINLTNAQKTTISIKRVNFSLFSFEY